MNPLWATCLVWVLGPVVVFGITMAIIYTSPWLGLIPVGLIVWALWRDHRYNTDTDRGRGTPG